MKITPEMTNAAYGVMIKRYAKGADESEYSTKAALAAAIEAALAVAEDEDFARAGKILDELAKYGERLNGELRIEVAKTSTALGLARHGLNALGEWA